MKTLLLVLMVCCLSSIVSGQSDLIKSIGKTAQEKANAKDFNTTRNNKERGNLMDDKSKEASPAPSSSAPASSESAPVEETSTEASGDYQASYTFTSSVTYQIESSKKPGESQIINYNFGDQVVKMDANSQGMASILDSKNGVMIMLNDKEKTAMVMSTKAMEAAMQQQQMNQGNKPASKITRTGRTKTILGYKCEEMLIESDKKTEVWITKDAGIDVSNTFANMSKTSASQIPSEAFTEGGMLMEMNSIDQAGKPEMHMVMTALSKETKTVNIGAYKITKL